MYYTNLLVNAIVKLPHPRSRDNQGKEKFLAPSVDNQTCNYDTECSYIYMGIANWIAIYINIAI